MHRIVSCSALLALAGMAAAQSPAPAASNIRETSIQVQVAADGRVTEVVPDNAMPESVRQSLIRHIGNWRYTPGQWQGKPVATVANIALRLELLPTTQGGLVLRVLDDKGQLGGRSRWTLAPPRYPMPAAKRNVGGTFVYALTQQVDGSLGTPELVWSYGAGAGKHWLPDFDAASRTAFAASHGAPWLADGQAVACKVVIPMSFFMAGADALSPQMAAAEAQARDAAIARLRAELPDVCPQATLETSIAGIVL